MCVIPQRPTRTRTVKRKSFSSGNWMARPASAPVTRISIRSFCLPIKSEGKILSHYLMRVSIWKVCDLNVSLSQRAAVGGETRIEACVTAEKTRPAQRAGTCPPTSLRPGTRASQEAAETTGGTVVFLFEISQHLNRNHFAKSVCKFLLIVSFT